MGDATKKRHDGRNRYKEVKGLTLPLRLQPDDFTDNFLEFLSEGNTPPEDLNTDEFAREHDKNDHARKGVLTELKLWITPPGHGQIRVPNPKLNTFQDLKIANKLVARLYCQEHGCDPFEVTEAGKPRWQYKRVRFILATAPTASHDADESIAPAGAWNVTLRYKGKRTYFHFYVQSDQSASQSSKGGKRAYLDHENYESHVRNDRATNEKPITVGNLRSSYHYDPIIDPGGKSQKDAEYWRAYGPVQRRGTHNALASVYDDPDDHNEKIGAKHGTYASPYVCIAGYEALHGRPAHYSGVTDGATGEIFGRTRESGREVLSAAFPSEDAPHHFGLLSAGAKDGSTVAYRGTSMATGLATRLFVDAFIENPKNREVGSREWFRRYGAPKTDHWGQASSWQNAHALEIGAGHRVRYPDSLSLVRRVHRMNNR